MDHYRGGDGTLNCPVVCRLRGALEPGAIAEALDRLTARHEALRTTLTGRARHLTQVIHEPRPLSIADVDLSREEAPETAVRRRMAEELALRIDPARWPARATLWRLAPDDHVLCLNVHHALTDAWSSGVLFRELCLLAGRGGRAVALPAIGWQYADFAEHEAQALAGAGFRAHEEYWRRQLRAAEVPALPMTPASDPAAPRATACEAVDIGRDDVRRLQLLAQAERSTLFTVMLALYYALLNQETGQTDLAVASVFANRIRREVEHTVGFLANMVVLRVRVGATATVADVVKKTQATVREAFVHQGFPSQLLPLDTVRTAGRRVDDVVFQMLTDPSARAAAGGIDGELLVPDGIGSRFELELSLVPRGGGFRVLLYYNAMRVDPAWAREFVKGYASLAAAGAANPAAPVARITT